MACHTSLKEIGERLAGVIWLPMEEGYVCGADTRLRRRVDLKGAVNVIQATFEANPKGHRVYPKADLKEFTWDAVAERMWHLLVES
jgi:hypothetical protein